jgi:WD40 repeat protein
VRAKHANATGSSAQRTTLTVFARTLRRETHNLSKRPELLWQQFHNRLQWDEGALPQAIGRALRRRAGRGGEAWVRTRTPFRESESLIRVLGGHTGPVGACAFRPNGPLLASASADRTVRLWEVETGREWAVLEGHTDSVRACAFPSRRAADLLRQPRSDAEALGRRER